MLWTVQAVGTIARVSRILLLLFRDLQWSLVLYYHRLINYTIPLPPQIIYHNAGASYQETELIETSLSVDICSLIGPAGYVCSISYVWITQHFCYPTYIFSICSLKHSFWSFSIYIMFCGNSCCCLPNWVRCHYSRGPWPVLLHLPFFEHVRYLLWTLGWTPADGHIINLPAFLFIPVLILLYISVQNYTWRKSDLLWILVFSEPTVFNLIAGVEKWIWDKEEQLWGAPCRLP